MKKLFVVIGLLVFAFGHSQEKEKVDFPKNEIKGNALFLVLGAIEVTYERLLNEDSGLGVSLFFINQEDSDTNFSFTPYYRAYFGKKPTAGFFVEGFSMINSGQQGSSFEYNSFTNNYDEIKGDKFTDFALGFGLGSKWIHSKGYVFEINAGIGRNLLSDNSPEVVGRGGITLGYRF
ncbi:DUF3575 domain-containing protein [Flavobacterium sp.]|uniref:DUF3575 domain-containing protein n=1 Tax=Flavobacterium sp. TaxID=239 RepID=UPI00286EA4B6|nr:DUF3575 domain-containing protein [Flavobacterium sp.]